MVITQRRSKRTLNGSKYIDDRSKRKYEMKRAAALTKLGARKTKSIRIKGANKKTFLFSEEVVNLADKGGKIEKVKIKQIVENPANRHFVRRNIITKGSIIMTDKGKAKITSRPGQEGSINAVLV